MPDLIPFEFHGRTVRLLVFEDGHEEWIAKDVCDVLELVNVHRTLARLKDAEKGVHRMNTPGGMQTMRTVKEAGLYRLIFRSDKPEAQEFQTWVFQDVLPSIRKTGKYDTADMSEGDMLVRMAERYRDQERRIKAIEQQQRNDMQQLVKNQQDMIELQKGVIEANENALLAVQSMQWVTIRQYVEIHQLHHQLPPSLQRSYAIWLTTYCLERGSAMYKASTADKDWPYEKTYCIAVIQDTLKAWLKRRGGTAQAGMNAE